MNVPHSGPVRVWIFSPAESPIGARCRMSHMSRTQNTLVRSDPFMLPGRDFICTPAFLVLPQHHPVYPDPNIPIRTGEDFKGHPCLALLKQYRLRPKLRDVLQSHVGLELCSFVRHTVSSSPHNEERQPICKTRMHPLHFREDICRSYVVQSTKPSLIFTLPPRIQHQRLETP